MRFFKDIVNYTRSTKLRKKCARLRIIEFERVNGCLYFLIRLKNETTVPDLGLFFDMGGIAWWMVDIRLRSKDKDQGRVNERK